MFQLELFSKLGFQKGHLQSSILAILAIDATENTLSHKVSVVTVVTNEQAGLIANEESILRI